MALKDIWKDLVDGVSEIDVDDINNIAGAVIDIEENGGGGSADLSNYYTKQEVEQKIDEVSDIADEAKSDSSQAISTSESANTTAQQAIANADNAIEIAQSVRADADSGKFDGEDGNDYVLTEADKTEIADLVTAELPESGTPRIEISEETVALEPNKFYVFPEMATLEITLGAEVDTAVVQEYKFRFTSGATATTLTLPDSVKGNIAIEPNSVVEVSIIDNYAVSQSWAVNA